MKSLKVFPRLTPLVLAALLLNFPGAATAQRRRRPARTHARPAAPAPPRTQTATPQTAPAPAPPSQTTPAPQTQTTLAPPPTRAAAPAREARPERSIEEMLSADGYAVYAEVRGVGTLARSEELKAAVGMLGRLGGSEVATVTEPVTNLFGFVSENAEVLAEARAVVTVMPTRAGLPQALVALELPSAEAAAAFDPKFRRVVGQESETFGSMLGARGPQPPRAPVARKFPAREATEKGAAGGAAEKSPDAQSFVVKRFGRLLLAAESPFTLRRLRGEEGAGALAESVRFQSVRSRFASDSVFVYVDTTLAQQGYAVEQQRAQEESEARAASDKQASGQYDVAVRNAEGPSAARPSPSATPTAGATLSATVTPAESPTPASAAPATTAPPTTGGRASAVQTPEPSPQVPAVVQQTPEQPTEEEDGAAEAGGRAGAGGDEKKVAAPVAGAANAAKPSEEQATVWRMGGVLRGIWEGAPRVPGAVALGLSLSGGTLAARLAVENTPDGVVGLIPFLPNIVSGPPVTADAAQVAPADSDIFFTTSLDWTQIYNATLGTASLNPERLAASWEEADEGDAAAFKPRPGEKVPTAGETVAAAEKLFGFKFREDLLPALGNEVAVSAPLDFFSGGYMMRKLAEKKEEKESEPGVVVIVSLNNPDKVREILPRVLTALNFVSYGAAFAPPEKREGFEIRSLGGSGGLSYTIIENFLVASEEVKAVRHCIDSYAARRTLAAQDAYRDATEWQPRQKLAEAYVSEELTRSAAESTKRLSGGSADPVVRALIAQLDVRPEPAAYEVTNEGDVLVHEVRVPLSLLKVYAASAMIGVRDAPVITGEAMALLALNRIRYAEQDFKIHKEKKRYGTLEELVGEQLLEKDFVAHLEYKVELEASGDRFEATATPKNYGKTGRRSFFVGEDGVLRGADHAGRPATADDPPIN